jgi:hypothetical protein
MEGEWSRFIDGGVAMLVEATRPLDTIRTSGCGGSHKVWNVCTPSHRTIAPRPGTGVPARLGQLGHGNVTTGLIGTDAERHNIRSDSSKGIVHQGIYDNGEKRRTRAAQ